MNQLDDQYLYRAIRDILTAAHSRVYSAVNSAIVDAYWRIGQLIVE